MDLQRKEFWKAFLRVFLVSLISLIVCVLLFCLMTNPVGIYVYLLILLIIYSLVEACIVFKKRAAIRCDNLTRLGDYLFAGLRFVIILIPPAVAEACIVMMWMIYSMASVGYHG